MVKNAKLKPNLHKINYLITMFILVKLNINNLYII